jgi:hypothetical protein
MYPYVLLLVFTTLSHCIASPLSPDLPDGQIVLNPDPSFNSHRSASLQDLEVDPPRPDKTPYYDPRELGGSLLNVRIGPHSTQFLAKPIFPHTELIQSSDDPEKSMGRRRTVECHYQRAIESRRIEEEWVDRFRTQFGHVLSRFLSRYLLRDGRD